MPRKAQGKSPDGGEHGQKKAIGRERSSRQFVLSERFRCAATPWMVQGCRPPSLIFALLLLLTAPLCLGLFLRLSRAATPNIITVNTTDDPANTSNNGSCTLREAIDNANSPGIDTTQGDCVVATGNDTIEFSVPHIDLTP